MQMMHNVDDVPCIDESTFFQFRWQIQKDMFYLRRRMLVKGNLLLLQKIMKCIKYVFRVKVGWIEIYVEMA